MNTKIAYMDDTKVLNQEFSQPDVSVIRESVIAMREKIDYACEELGEIWGYRIIPNKALEQIYQFPVNVVRFYFSGISRFHDKEQERIVKKVMDRCHAEMKENPGYYVVRIPTHIVDCVRVNNNYNEDVIFCGGIVEFVTRNQAIEFLNNADIHIFFAEQDYLDRHSDRLCQISEKAFACFQGHYHISPVTGGRAGEIYDNWMHNILKCDDNNRVLIAEKKGEPIGYFSIAEDEHSVEAVLTAVDTSYRKLGAYRSMVGTLINYAYVKEKAMCAGTQIDNFISQGTWSSFGMVPYYSFYNMHYDYRRQV